MTVYVADAYARVQRLVLVIKMATVLEVYITEEQRSVVGLYGQKDSMRRRFMKKCFLFTAGSVYRVKLFTTGSRNSQMIPDQVVLLRLRQKQLRCSGRVDSS
jgi:hypothetical protein